ncbi:MAG: hypothetical protein EOM44_15325 [Bacteroidia bacterium]|nr:hypothetical protein [Bacteroidia bacterium]
MLTLTTLDTDLRPYGFIRVEYGRTWTTGGVSFIGGAMRITGRATEEDLKSFANLYKDGIIKFSNEREEKGE